MTKVYDLDFIPVVKGLNSHYDLGYQMKINVVKDKSGKVIATFQSASENGPQVKPIAKDDIKVEMAEVPDNYHSNLSSIYK